MVGLACPGDKIRTKFGLPPPAKAKVELIEMKALKAVVVEISVEEIDLT